MDLAGRPMDGRAMSYAPFEESNRIHTSSEKLLCIPAKLPRSGQADDMDDGHEKGDESLQEKKNLLGWISGVKGCREPMLAFPLCKFCLRALRFVFSIALFIGPPVKDISPSYVPILWTGFVSQQPQQVQRSATSMRSASLKHATPHAKFHHASSMYMDAR